MPTYWISGKHGFHDVCGLGFRRGAVFMMSVVWVFGQSAIAEDRVYGFPMLGHRRIVKNRVYGFAMLALSV
jgi:hypothetical protein